VPSRYLLEQMRGYWNNLILLPNPISLEGLPVPLRITRASWFGCVGFTRITIGIWPSGGRETGSAIS
jgi:hypothetical protein